MSLEIANILTIVVLIGFIVTWFVLGIGGYVVFSRGRDVVFKRKWFPRYVIVGGVLFVVFVSTLMALSARSLAPLGSLAVLVPLVGVFVVLNVVLTRFCGNCGRIVSLWDGPTVAKFCSKCGAKLDADTPGPDDRSLESSGHHSH